MLIAIFSPIFIMANGAKLQEEPPLRSDHNSGATLLERPRLGVSGVRG